MMFSRRRMNKSIIRSTKRSENMQNRSSASLSKINESNKGIPGKYFTFSQQCSQLDNTVAAPVTKNLNYLIRRPSISRGPWPEGLSFVHKIKIVAPKTDYRSKSKKTRSTFVSPIRKSYKPRLLCDNLRLRSKSSEKKIKNWFETVDGSTQIEGRSKYIPIWGKSTNREFNDKEKIIQENNETAIDLCGW